MRSFDEVLKDDPKVEPVKAEEPTPAPEPAPAPEPKAEEPKPSKVEPGEPTAPKSEEEPRVPLKALEEERRKRQEYQRELESLRNAPKPADPVVDPEGFRKQFEEQSQKALLNERLNMSEQIVRAHHGDDTVNAAMQAFEEAQQSNPGLRATILSSRHPYQSLIDWHKREQVLATVGTDLTAYEKRLREQFMEEIKANPTALGVPAPTPAIAPTLANRPSVSARDQAWTGPTPIADILKN